MPTDTFVHTIRAHGVRVILEKVDSRCPSRRETDIQLAKLERMIDAFRKKFSYSQALLVLGGGGGSNAALRKRIGVESYKLDQQLKTTRKLLDKALEEGFYLDPAHTATRVQFRKALAEANRNLDKVTHDATKEMRKKVAGAVAEQRRISS
jgi:hypothetical protein